jgi:amino acid transporter
VTVSLVFASYVGAVFPFLGSTRIIAGLSCLGFMLLDMAGLRLSSTVNDALVLIKAGVLFFIIAGLPFVKEANFYPFFSGRR